MSGHLQEVFAVGKLNSADNLQIRPLTALLNLQDPAWAYLSQTYLLIYGILIAKSLFCRIIASAMKDTNMSSHQFPISKLCLGSQWTIIWLSFLQLVMLSRFKQCCVVLVSVNCFCVFVLVSVACCFCVNFRWFQLLIVTVLCYLNTNRIPSYVRKGNKKRSNPQDSILIKRIKS